MLLSTASTWFCTIAESVHPMPFCTGVTISCVNRANKKLLEDCGQCKHNFRVRLERNLFLCIGRDMLCVGTTSGQLTWLALGEDQAARSRRVEQLMALRGL